MSLYERQESLSLGEPSVAIVGCGGVGVWAALAICMGGASELVLYDEDTLSDHNLNRLPFPLSQVGQLKSEALANWLGSLRPDCQISTRGNFNPRLHNFEAVNWAVCGTDSLKSRQLVYHKAMEAGCMYLEIGADGERWSLGREPAQFSTELETEPGYQIVPVHVGPCMMAGAAAAYYVLHGTRPAGDHLGYWLWPDEASGRLMLAMSWPGDAPAELGEQVEEAVGAHLTASHMSEVASYPTEPMVEINADLDTTEEEE